MNVKINEISLIGKKVIAEVERAVVGKRGLLEMVMSAALAGGQIQQLDEGAVAHHDLARERVGLRQQALRIAAQHDLAGVEVAGRVVEAEAAPAQEERGRGGGGGRPRADARRDRR